MSDASGESSDAGSSGSGETIQHVFVYPFNSPIPGSGFQVGPCSCAGRVCLTSSTRKQTEKGTGDEFT